MANQISILLSFFITGICTGVLFDIFRISRKCFKIPNLLIYLEDVLFWILAGVLFIFTVFTFSEGQIRIYMVSTMILGSIIYFISISKYFIIINFKMINILKSIVFFILKPINKLIKSKKK